MGRVSILSVARLLASMFAAIEKATTRVWALEGSSPFFDCSRFTRYSATLSAVLRLLAVTTQDILLDLTAVATCRHANMASSAGTFVAWSRAAVLSTSHQLTTHLTTAPAVFIICVYAASSDGLGAAEAVLGRAHQGARRTRTGVTSHTTRMRALLR